MPYVLGVVAGLLLLGAVFFGLRRAAVDPPVTGSGPAASPVPGQGGREVAAYLTREDARKLLEKLAASSAPDRSTLKRGAMCYAAAPMDGVVSMVCTECSRKVSIARTSPGCAADECGRLVQAIRHHVGKAGWFGTRGALVGLDVRLDTGAACPECRKQMKGEPVALRLRVRYPDSGEHVAPVSTQSLKGILALLQGADRVLEGNDSEMPLKDLAASLREVLGLETRGGE